MQNKVAGSGNSGSRICPAAQPPTESTKAYRDPLRIGIRSWDPEDQLAQQDLRSLRRADNWQLCQRPHCLPSTTLGRTRWGPGSPLSAQPQPATEETRISGLRGGLADPCPVRTPGGYSPSPGFRGIPDPPRLPLGTVTGRKGHPKPQCLCSREPEDPREVQDVWFQRKPARFLKACPPLWLGSWLDSCQTTPLIQFLWLWMTKRGTCPWLNETAVAVSRLQLIWFGLVWVWFWWFCSVLVDWTQGFWQQLY